MLRLKKHIVKKMETHGNKSKIGKGGQVSMKTFVKDLKQGGVVT